MSRSTQVKETIDSDEYIFLPPAQARKALRVAASTLRLWDKSGKLHTERMPSGYRFYRIPVHMLDSATTRKQFAPETTRRQLHTKYHETQHIGEKLKYIYARVSTPKQKKSGDLQRQIEAMQKEYPDHKVLTDVASGINWKRPALKTLLELASKGMVEEIVVAHRDRLCRFAFELLEYIFSLHQTKITVGDTSATHAHTFETESDELAQDLMAINTVFICKQQSKRAAENRRKRKKQDEIESQREEVAGDGQHQGGQGNQ